MASLREEKTEKKYQKYLETVEEGHCPFCKKDLLVSHYKFWVILRNRFPYDKIAEKHDMLAPVRHISDYRELTGEEERELHIILDKEKERYTYYSMNMPKGRTVPLHLHYHLIKLYED